MDSRKLLLNEFSYAHHNACMRRFMVIVERHRILRGFHRVARHRSEFLEVFKNAVFKIFFCLRYRGKEQTSDLVDFRLREIALGLCASFILIDHFLRHHHRQSGKIVHEHLLHDNDVRDVPDQVVVESCRDFVELFQRIIVEEFFQRMTAGHGNVEGLLHGEIFDKNKQIRQQMIYFA
jgi:hypothetical protein